MGNRLKVNMTFKTKHYEDIVLYLQVVTKMRKWDRNIHVIYYKELKKNSAMLYSSEIWWPKRFTTPSSLLLPKHTHAQTHKYYTCTPKNAYHTQPCTVNKSEFDKLWSILANGLTLGYNRRTFGLQQTVKNMNSRECEHFWPLYRTYFKSKY